LVGEADAAGLSGAVGVAPDLEASEVVEAVVATAQGDEVVGVGWAAVFPVDDVVDVEAVAADTAWDAAAAVSVFDEAADPAGHDVDLSAQVDRGAVSFEDGAHGGVAGVEPA